MLCLRVSGYETSRTMFFDKSTISIGRVEGNDIVLPSLQVSKQHVQIITRGLIIFLVDAYSSNGTSLNGARISGSIQIKVNDKIGIGPYQIKLLPSNLSTESAGDASPADAGGAGSGDEATHRPYVRKMLNYVLRLDSQIDQFCIDYFPEVRGLISAGMDRTAKLNLIIECVDTNAIHEVMMKAYSARYVEFLAHVKDV